MARWRQQVWRAGSGSGAAGLVVIATTLMWAAEGDWSEFASVAPFGFLPQGHQPHPATPPPTAPPPPGTRVLAEHISLGGTPSPETMSVSWHTDGPVPAPLVRWGEAAGDGKGMEMEIATGETQVYLVSPNRSAYVHRASIGPIVAGRSYSYQAMHKGGPEGLAYSFVMPSGHLAAPHHPVSTSPPPQRVIIFGDSVRTPQPHPCSSQHLSLPQAWVGRKSGLLDVWVRAAGVGPTFAEWWVSVGDSGL